MNALANDQARRIASLMHTHRTELGDLTVDLYAGDSGTAPAMTATSVVESEQHMRTHPPDILLTNYTMLDRVPRPAGSLSVDTGITSSVRSTCADFASAS
ncbi:hypothetical protein ACLFMI_20500 [Pseudonocardia nantongensis]|uniref:hypothetical protein n=1 Tax=Pseudonocardia nantongensis TaxID=1181885 RepID=UPI00397E64C9